MESGNKAFDRLFLQLFAANAAAFKKALDTDRAAFQSFLDARREDWLKWQADNTWHNMAPPIISRLMQTRARSLTRVAIHYTWQELQKDSPEEAPPIVPYGIGELSSGEKRIRTSWKTPSWPGQIPPPLFEEFSDASIFIDERSFAYTGADNIQIPKGIEDILALLNEPAALYQKGPGASPPTAQPPSPPPSPFNRYLTGKMPGEVKGNEIFDLTVQITVDAIPETTSAASAPFPDMSGDILVTVHGSGVEFLETSAIPLNLPRTGNSEIVTFKVKALVPGVQRIEVSAWNGAARIAGLTLFVAVDDQLPPLKEKTATTDMRMPGEGEYAFEIIYDPYKEQYSFQLRGGKLKDMPPALGKPLSPSEKNQYQTMLEGLNALAKNTNLLTPRQLKERPRSIGNFLFQYMVPEEIREALWEIRDDIRQLNIICDGPAIPWELIYVSKKGHSSGFFLGQKAGVARWIYGPPPPSKINNNPCFFVQAGKTLQKASAEIQKLQTLFNKSTVIQTVDDLLTLLQQGQFGMLHIASHNIPDVDNAMASYIPFATGRLELIDMGTIEDDKFLPNTPLVFMNSCASASTAPLLTTLSSWADQYLKLGAGAFIGSLWEVVDQSAPLFAVTFYEKVKAGATLGEAVKAARDLLLSKDETDPTWLAYTLYGNPLAKFETP